MPRIIVTSRYLKPNKNKSNTGVANLVLYIATRETVEHYTPNDIQIDYTKQLNALLEKFPDSKKSFEYADYKADPSPHNAKELVYPINFNPLITEERFASKIATRKAMRIIA